jgi:hypothetical protein
MAAPGDARAALRRLVDGYAIEADRRDGAALAALFVEDGRLLLHEDGDPDAAPTREVIGRTKIESAIGRLERYRRTFHLVGQHIADLIDDDHATAITYCQAHHVTVADDGSASDYVMHIRYLDDFVRDEGGDWRFETRHLVLVLTETHPVNC